MTAQIQCKPTPLIWVAPAVVTPPAGEGVFGEGGEQLQGEGGELIQGE